MDLYNIIIENKEIFKFVYTIIIAFICFIIVMKTHRLFHLSLYQGIRYFRNAFFFYGLASITRLFLLGIYFPVIKIIFEFFIIMGGFFLLYSLLWKRIETKDSISSLFNKGVMLFYILALIISFLDYLWQTFSFMFISQIILFIFASIVSYNKYRKSEGGDFLRLYFIVIILNLIAWTTNFIVAYFLNWYQAGVIGVYVMNMIIFFLFLYGVLRVTTK